MPSYVSVRQVAAPDQIKNLSVFGIVDKYYITTLQWLSSLVEKEDQSSRRFIEKEKKETVRCEAFLIQYFLLSLVHM